MGTQCFTSSPQGRFEHGAALLNGREMTEARSVGKHLFLRFDREDAGGLGGGAPSVLGESGDLDEGALPNPGTSPASPLWLHVHLGLYGAWRFHADPSVEVAASIGAPRTAVQAPDLGDDTGIARPRNGRNGNRAPGQLPRRENEGLTVSLAEAEEDEWCAPEPVGAVRLRIDNGRVAADLAGPTRCEVLSPEEVEQVVDRLGPDPLDHESDPKALRRAFIDGVRSSKRPIGELVMDQSVIAGVGNIYRAEGLFRQGISPNRRGANVSAQRLGALWDDYVGLLERGVEEGRITTVRPEDRPDFEVVEESDPEALRWYVYHRSGRKCLVCGEEVSEKEVQSRRLFWCATCQK